MKKAFKAIITSILGWQVRRLRGKHAIRIIGVTGSMGKTSTKLAIATMLRQHYRVQSQEGNYNDLVTVPLVFFNQALPSLLNPFAWAKTLINIELQLNRPYPYDIVVLELGTDGPGQIASFNKYLKLDLLVVTAIKPEHMEFFKDLNAVAEEELAASGFSKVTLLNTDLCEPAHIGLVKTARLTYGIDKPADYHLEINNFSGTQYDFSIRFGDKTLLSAKYDGVSELELYSLLSAVAVAHRFSLPVDKITAGIGKLTPFSGRLRRLAGINDSLILDDTYNASPDAVKLALDTLYGLKSPQKIALLGNMNELGDYSEKAHTMVGEYCSPKELDMLITIGPDANKYLAAAAQKRGCQVKTFNDPYQAGQYIKTIIKPKAIILAKGSQNGVYAEEAIKQFLANPKDQKQLVRQSPEWLAKKRRI